MRLSAFLFAALIGPWSLVPARGDAGAQAKPMLNKAAAAAKDSAKASAKAPKAASKDSVAKPSRDTLPPPLRDLGQEALKAFKAPEKLVFDIVWGGWSFRWVNAGQATVELLPTTRPDQWRIQSLARSNKFFQSFYPVRDTVFSIIDARGIYPLRFEKRLHEGGYHAKVSATYDQEAHTLATLDTTLAIEPFTHDVLSALFFIRTQPLKVGDSFDLAAVSGNKKYNLRVICHGRDRSSAQPISSGVRRRATILLLALAVSSPASAASSIHM